MIENEMCDGFQIQRVPGSNELGDFKVDSVFHPSRSIKWVAGASGNLVDLDSFLWLDTLETIEPIYKNSPENFKIKD